MLTATTNQHTWVYGCYTYYLENQIEPGNPEDGVWEAAHWPVPACKGGTKTILLLKEHHAVHGVLQSEEWQCPCVYSWEKHYLDKELLVKYAHWMKVKAQPMLDYRANMTPEERQKLARRIVASTDPEVYKRSGAHKHPNKGKGCRERNAQRWRCTVTGFETNSGCLTLYQRARGIDTVNRERAEQGDS